MSTSTALALRREVINIYKGKSPLSFRTIAVTACPSQHTSFHQDVSMLINPELLNLGKDYPGGGYAYFKPRLHKAFSSQAHLEDENAIREAIKRAEFVKKEIEAL